MANLWHRKCLRISTYLGIGLISFLLLIIGLLQQPLVQKYIAHSLSQRLSVENIQINITPIKGFFPFNIEFAKLSIADKQGVWLQLEKARLAWSFQALLTGEIQIDELSGKRLWIKRLPTVEKLEEKNHTAIEIPRSLPDLNLNLPIVNIRYLGIDEIQLEPSVLGQALNLNVIANAQTVGQKIKAKLQLKRTDQASLNLKLDALIDLNPLKITTTVHLDETGGLLAALTHQPTLKNLHLDLKAQGLLTDWRVNLTTKIDGLAQLKTQIQLGIGQQPWLNLQAMLRLQTGLLTQKTVDLLGIKQQLDIQLVAADSNKLHLKQLSFKNALLSLNSKATLELSTQKINAQMRLKLAQLEKLNHLAGLKLSGRSRLKLDVNGSFSQPKINAKAMIKNLKINDFSSSNCVVKLQLSPLKTLRESQFKIALQGSISQLKQHGKALPDPNLSWTLTALSDKKQTVDLKHFQVDGQWSHLQLAGFFDSKQQQGDFKLQLNLDHLKAVTTAIKAKIKATAQIKIYPYIKKIAIKLNSELLQFTGLDKSISQLLGKRIHLDSQIELTPKNYVTVKQLRMKAKAIHLQANSVLNLKNQQLKGQLQLNIPHFKNKYLNLRQAKISAAINGSTKKPTVDLLATLPQLDLAKQSLKAIKLQASFKDVIENLHGQWQLNLRQQKQAMTLKSNYYLKNKQLKLNNILVKAPKTELTGGLLIDLSGSKITGKLIAKSDLKGLKPWFKQSMQGKLMLSSEFKSVNNQQFIHLKSQIKQFKMQNLTLATLDLNAKIRDALNKARINAKLNLSELKQQQTQVKQLKISASGLLEQLKLQMSAKGNYQYPFNISIDASLRQKDRQTQLQLQKITGKVVKQRINLAKMTTLTLNPKKIQLSPLSLFIGQAHLQGQMNYNQQKLKGYLQLGLPLSLVNKLTETTFKGDVTTEVQLSGTAAQPQLDLAVKFNNIGLTEEDYEKFPATQVQLKAHFKQQQLQANLAIKNPQFKKPLHAQLQLPMQLQFNPFKFKLFEQHPLQGQLTAALNLEDLTKNIPFKEQKLAGAFNTHLNLTGTFKQPKLDGRLTLTKGDYQNAVTETHLKAIQLHIDAKPEKITLTRLSLKDTKKGNINGHGTLSLTKDSNYPFTAALNFNHIQLINNSQLTTHLSGGLTLKGDRQRALVSGQLNIDDFDLTLLPVNSQDNIPELEVIEIGAHLPTVKPQKTKKAENKKAFKTKLDIGVKIANQFYIKGYGLDSEWKGKLKIKGDALKPKVLGKIQTKRGSFELLNNRFLVRRGLIDFNGAYPPLPSLNIETIATLEEGKAIIHISGMANNPQLKLSHRPSRPQDEILSSLLFKNNTKSISPIQALKLADVATMLASGGLLNINALGRLQTGLGLDRLSLDGDNFNTATVKAGKYITDNIYLEVEQGLQGDSSTATVEIDLLPDIKAEVEFNQNADSSVGIKWKHDY